MGRTGMEGGADDGERGAEVYRELGVDSRKHMSDWESYTMVDVI